MFGFNMLLWVPNISAMGALGEGPDLIVGAPSGLGGGGTYNSGTDTLTFTGDSNLGHWDGVLAAGHLYHFIIPYNKTAGAGGIRISDGVAVVWTGPDLANGSGSLNATFTTTTGTGFDIQANNDLYTGDIGPNVECHLVS